MIITGTLLKVETRTGDMPDKENPGEVIRWDFDLLTVFTDAEEIVEVKVPRADAAIVRSLAKGTVVTLEVRLPKGTRVTLDAGATYSLSAA